MATHLLGFRCFFCEVAPTEFSMLTCSHLICGECMATFHDSRSEVISITCPCGVVTTIPRQIPRESCILKPYSSLKRNNSQIMDRSEFLVTGYSRSSGKTGKTSFGQAHKPRAYSHSYLVGELSNELKFTELRFKRYLNEINRSYNRMVADLNQDYQDIVQSVSKKCRFKIESQEITTLSTIQSLVEKAFRPTLQKRVSKITKYLNQVIGCRPTEFLIGKRKENDCNQINDRSSAPRSNSKGREREHRKQVSGHELCKKECDRNFLARLKSATVKNSKIKKRKLSNTRITCNQLIL